MSEDVAGPTFAQLIFPAIIALVMVGVAFSVLWGRFRDRAEPGKPLPVSAWPGRNYDELRLNGEWQFSQSVVRRRVEGGLRADNARKGSPAVVANVVADLRAWVIWAYRFEVLLRFTDRTVRLTGGGFLDFPWTMAPRPNRLTVLQGDKPIGTLEFGDGEIVGRDTTGTTVASWQIVKRLGSMLPGSDEAVYAPLRFRGRRIVDLRVPRWRTQSRQWLDFEGVPFVRDLDLGNDPAAEIWLLAYLALGAQASLNLMARSRRRPLS